MLEAQLAQASMQGGGQALGLCMLCLQALGILTLPLVSWMKEWKTSGNYYSGSCGDY